MKPLRLVFVATFVGSLALGLSPGMLHPYSWRIALLDWSVLVALLVPAVGFLAGTRRWRIGFGVVCALAALVWGAVPFIPTDLDRGSSEFYLWAYYEALFIAGTFLTLSSLRQKSSPSPQTTSASGRA